MAHIYDMLLSYPSYPNMDKYQMQGTRHCKYNALSNIHNARFQNVKQKQNDQLKGKLRLQRSEKSWCIFDFFTRLTSC